MATRKDQLKIDIRHNRGDFEAAKNGDIDRISGKDNLEQALNHRLITVKGSLSHRPEYGIGIQEWQGQLNNIDKQRNLALIIQEQFLKDERVTSVDQISFEAEDLTPDLFKIFVKYSALGYNDIDGSFDPFELGA